MFPMDGKFKIDRKWGVRQFTVGTGGHSLYEFIDIKTTISEERYNGAFGIIRLTLAPNSYSWVFVPVGPGKDGRLYSDSGSDSCHGMPPNSDSLTNNNAPTILQELKKGFYRAIYDSFQDDLPPVQRIIDQEFRRQPKVDSKTAVF